MLHSSALPSLLSCLPRPTHTTLYTQPLKADVAFRGLRGLSLWPDDLAVPQPDVTYAGGCSQGVKKGASVSLSQCLLRIGSSEAALLRFPRCNCRIFRSHTVCTWTRCCQDREHPRCLYTGRDPPLLQVLLKGRV